MTQDRLGGPNVDGNGPLAFGNGSPNVDVTVSPQLEHTFDTTRKRKASQTQDNRAQLPKYGGRVTRSKAKATHI
ncbi:hypothetical protein K445DRAFT_316013 [Daldinia sp. EC12]|nr:hypothetical protein K445DRAFT_316013 [Daldinia sp. EC12]